MFKNGHLQSWKDFELDAYLLDSEYNNRWLETEFNQTIATVNMANKFADFQKNTDLYPNLKFVTINDARVRPEHKAFDGIIKPVNDAFWNTHMPPLDWGCRCDLEQTDEEPTEGLPADDIVKEEFKNNPLKTGKVFTSEAYSVDFTNLEKDRTSIKSLKLLAHNSDSSLQQFAKQKIYELPVDKQFEIVKEFKGGGSVQKHLLVNTNAEDYNDILNVSNAFAKQGKKVEILPEIHISEPNARKKILSKLDHKSSNPDLKVDGVYMDVKRPKAIKNITGNANQASKQSAVAVISDSQLDKKMNKEIMTKRAEAILNEKNKENYSSDEIYFFNDGDLFKYP
ncbi:phage minor head protein [Chryseobacterium herbae]|uniref:Phage minor head protein n=1 Tax=Chryseobacterium herbae TaxID=2976476 RepID=A0ABT2IYN8_9FLAO|nr:phage minor head protein [Chryseobacterium sp. pc1-10]MCT2563964.1 phage minor head protein [Chryseobacterium sp. pc1-10]